MAKAENKTQPTRNSVQKFISSIEDEQMQKDCKTLSKFMEQVTGHKPVLWGESIVGFGSYHYKYASGKEGDSCLTGFSPRKQALSIYTSCYLEENDLLTKSLGKFKNGKSCIYVKKLDDIDLVVLEKILRYSIKRLKEMYP
jgi:Domain of unknown function (DU1801)